MSSNSFINSGGVHYSAGFSSAENATNRCGSTGGSSTGRRRRKHTTKRHSRKTFNKRKHKTTKRHKHRRLTKGGYYQYGSNQLFPVSAYGFNPNVVTPYSSALANPMPFREMNNFA